MRETRIPVQQMPIWRVQKPLPLLHTHTHTHIPIYIYIQGVSGGIVNILGGGSMDCSE